MSNHFLTFLSQENQMLECFVASDDMCQNRYVVSFNFLPVSSRWLMSHDASLHDHTISVPRVCEIQLKSAGSPLNQSHLCDPDPDFFSWIFILLYTLEITKNIYIWYF